jgi:DNA-directed RNA polymerase specialized sigma subunit
MGSLEGNDINHFRFFAEQVCTTVNRFGSLTKDQLTEMQRDQVDGLAKLEVDFKELLIKHDLLEAAFNIFYDYIINERRNLLSARPYFRERNVVFSQGLMQSMKDRDFKTTARYHINYHFIGVVIDKLGLPKVHPIRDVYSKIMNVRQELVLMNLPLVISRARIFYGKTPRSHLSFMDLVQIGIKGMLSAVDKYCGAYQTGWRGVVTQRIRGDHIHQYSETMLHFYPRDKKRLYRANKFKSRNVEGDFTEEDMLSAINDKEVANMVTAEQIRQIVLAASTVSCDTRPPIDDENLPDENIVKIAAPDEDRPDFRVEKQESLALMFKHIKTLPLIDQKILKLKGIDIDY